MWPPGGRQQGAGSAFGFLGAVVDCRPTEILHYLRHYTISSRLPQCKSRYIYIYIYRNTCILPKLLGFFCISGHAGCVSSTVREETDRELLSNVVPGRCFYAAGEVTLGAWVLAKDLGDFERISRELRALLQEGPLKDHVNIRILQTMVSGIPLVLGLGTKV